MKLLGYTEKLTSFAPISAPLADLLDMLVHFTAYGNPVWVEFGASSITNSTAGGLTLMECFEGSTALGSTAIRPVPSGAGPLDCYKRFRLGGANTPSVGNHDYKLQAGYSGFGTGAVTVAGGAVFPCFLAIWDEVLPAS